MGKKLISLFAFFGFFILFLLSGCKKAERGESLAQIGRERPEILQIVHATPCGQLLSLRDAETIVVSFDREMVPLEALPEDKIVSFMEINPPTSGKFRWMGTKTLTFSPDTRFPFSTEIRIRIPKGTQSLDGHILGEDFSWSFQTPRPRLISHFPEDKQRGLRLDTKILLVFNQPILKDKGKSYSTNIFLSGMGLSFSSSIPGLGKSGNASPKSSFK